ncbi:MAG: hypothetical protein DMD26_10520 [Gemmatimonadetes bacterium]|nr:MAG: hypothetical protein DMD26_10520 [Gemmatimonadota bacterium]
MQDLDERALVDRVMVEWWDSAAHALPWAAMALDDRFGELRRLAAALVSAAVVTGGHSRDPQESGARNGVIAAAIDHGRYRGHQGGTWELLLFELTFLNSAPNEIGAHRAPPAIRNLGHVLLVRRGQGR